MTTNSSPRSIAPCSPRSRPAWVPGSPPRAGTALLVLLASLLLAGSAASAPDVAVLGGQEYRRVDDGWQVLTASGEVFAVDPDVITVRFASGVTESERTELIRANDTQVLRANRLGFIDLRVAPGADVIEVVQSFLGSDLIDTAEPNAKGSYFATPNDPRYPQQWHLNQSSDADIDAPEAWDTEIGERTVVVGILDSGSDWTHEDLGLGSDPYQNIWLNPGEDRWTNPNNPNTGNGLDDDGNGFIDDWKGWDFYNGDNDSRGVYDHGTRVAGIVAAKTHNGRGIAGVAGGFGIIGGLGVKGCKVMIVGVGDFAPDTSILDDAILYATDNGARVITMSLTLPPTTAIQTALQDAWDSGLLIDCASGNTSDAVSFPASDPNVIAVGATTQSDLLAYFSCRGVDQELAAPGVDILSCTFNDSYGAENGTSFSAPIVGGVGALIFSVNQALTNADARQILRDTADKVGPYNYNWNPAMPGHSQELGYGRVNANAAVLEAAASSATPDGLGSPTTRLLFLQPNAPNPFDPATLIRYDLGREGHVTVTVQSVLGRSVTTLVDEVQPAGTHAVTWDGRDAFGRPVPSGLYLYRVRMGEAASTGKMLLTR